MIWKISKFIWVLFFEPILIHVDCPSVLSSCSHNVVQPDNGTTPWYPWYDPPGLGYRGGCSSMVPWSTWSAWSAVELLASWSKPTKRCAKSVVSGVNDLHMLGFPHLDTFRLSSVIHSPRALRKCNHMDLSKNIGYQKSIYPPYAMLNHHVS